MQIEAAISYEGAPAPVIEPVELGEPRAGEILVKVAAVGICHTDLRIHAQGGWGSPKPIVLGHEGAGAVEAVGAGVTHVRPGDRVALSGSSCGECPSCRRNFPSYCREAIPRSFGGRRNDGSSAISHQGHPIGGHFFGQSSFATYAIADAKGAVKIGDDVPFAVAAPLGCGVITGAGSVLHAFALRPDQTIVVFGAGSVGLSAIMAARLVGARRIVAVDPVAARRALAVELGADDAIDPAAGDVPAAIRAVLPDGADFSFNTTNNPGVFEAAVHVLGMQGRAGFVTTPTAPPNVPMGAVLGYGRSIQGIIGGSAAPQVTIPMLLDHWRAGRFPVERLVTEFPFASIGDAFAQCRAAEVIKPVLIV